MSNEMIFQDNRCRGDDCPLDGAEKLQLDMLAESHPGNVAVAICSGRSRFFGGCGLEVHGLYTPENAQELKAIIIENNESQAD